MLYSYVADVNWPRFYGSLIYKNTLHKNALSNVSADMGAINSVRPGIRTYFSIYILIKAEVIKDFSNNYYLISEAFRHIFFLRK